MCTFIKCIRTSWSCALLYTVGGSSPAPREAGGDGGETGFLGSSGAFVVDCWNTLGESSNDGSSPGTTRPALVWNKASSLLNWESSLLDKDCSYWKLNSQTNTNLHFSAHSEAPPLKFIHTHGQITHVMCVYTMSPFFGHITHNPNTTRTWQAYNITKVHVSEQQIHYCSELIFERSWPCCMNY